MGFRRWTASLPGWTDRRRANSCRKGVAIDAEPAYKAPPPFAGWSSPVARQAHNLKVISSNLVPATTLIEPTLSPLLSGLFSFWAKPAMAAPTSGSARVAASSPVLRRSSSAMLAGSLTGDRAGAASSASRCASGVSSSSSSPCSPADPAAADAGVVPGRPAGHRSVPFSADARSPSVNARRRTLRACDG